MPSNKTVPRICEICGASFFVRPQEARRGGGRFCGNTCSGKWKYTNSPPPSLSGVENPNWKGGLTKSSRGYWYVRMPEHPRAHKSGYIKRANLVAEKTLGRYLLPGEIVHHKDQNKENDSPENLEVVQNGKHTLIHHPKTRIIIYKPDHPCNRRYVWPKDEALLEMHARMSLRVLAKKIGCSHKTVDRRIKRIQKKQETIR